MPGGTTRQTLVDRDGDGTLERGPGEPLRDRGRVAPTARVLATLVQLSDLHVRDEESPGRVPFLDRLGARFGSTFRPQEALTAQVLDAAVRAANAVHPDALIASGDLIDNAQSNELALAAGVLNGGRVDPDSGARGYEGVQALTDPDPFYYRPDVDAPVHPGLLERAQRPFRARGSRAPWLPVAGNHDLLVQGELAATPVLSAAATGTRAVTAPNDQTLALNRQEGLSAEQIDALVAAGLPGRSLTVSADPDRRLLTPGEAIGRLAGASRAVPMPLADPAHLNYAVDVGRYLRIVVLDVVRRDRGAEGLVDASTQAFVDAELARRHDRAIFVVSHQPLSEAEGAAPLLARLRADRRVKALLYGHRHRTELRPAGDGLWELGAPSLADFPQQGRILRLVRTRTGGLALESEMLDHAGRPGDPAGISRALSFLDAQGGRPGGFRGARSDRNVRLALR